MPHASALHDLEVGDTPDTPLTRALSGPVSEPRSTPMDAFEVARAWFLEGRKLDMQQLAAELGVGRATLYRWCGSRELLLGEVLWSVQRDALGAAWGRTRGDSVERLVRTLTRLLRDIREYEPLRVFFAEGGEYALRVLTSNHSIVQRRLIDWFAQWLRDEVDLDPTVDPNDLAYAIVRVLESFVWSDMITGAAPQPDTGGRMAGLLVSAAVR